MLVEQQILLGDASWTVAREHSFPGLGGWWHEAQSRALFCPHCGRTWAHLLLASRRLVWPATAFCEDCGDTDPDHPVPGSLFHEEGWTVIDTALLDVLPEPLLRREFTLHMKAFSKEL